MEDDMYDEYIPEPRSGIKGIFDCIFIYILFATVMVLAILNSAYKIISFKSSCRNEAMLMYNFLFPKNNN